MLHGRAWRYWPPDETPVVDLTGGPPGSCAIDLVRESISPLCTLVLVMDLLQVPPSWARAFDISCRLLALPPTLLLLRTHKRHVTSRQCGPASFNHFPDVNISAKQNRRRERPAID